MSWGGQPELRQHLLGVRGVIILALAENLPDKPGTSDFRACHGKQNMKYAYVCVCLWVVCMCVNNVFANV